MSRPSTLAGDALGSAKRGAARVFDYALPLAAVSAYRLIPDERRGKMFGGQRQRVVEDPGGAAHGGAEGVSCPGAWPAHSWCSLNEK